MSVALAVFLFAARAVLDGFNAATGGSSSTRIVTIRSTPLIFPMPTSHANSIRNTAGVQDLTWANWSIEKGQVGWHIDSPDHAPKISSAIDPRLRIVGAFLAESVVVALIGGVIGCLLALPVHGLSTGTANMASFSEVAFKFRITPALLAGGLVCAALMGAVGGLLPALRAARIPVARALREI